MLIDYVVPRPSAYLPNCDNLAALLGSSIDDPLLRSSSFPIYSCVKPEPFDGYTEASKHPTTTAKFFIQFLKYYKFTIISCIKKILDMNENSVTCAF